MAYYVHVTNPKGKFGPHSTLAKAKRAAQTIADRLGKSVKVLFEGSKSGGKRSNTSNGSRKTTYQIVSATGSTSLGALSKKHFTKMSTAKKAAQSAANKKGIAVKIFKTAQKGKSVVAREHYKTVGSKTKRSNSSKLHHTSGKKVSLGGHTWTESIRKSPSYSHAYVADIMTPAEVRGGKHRKERYRIISTSRPFLDFDGGKQWRLDRLGMLGHIWEAVTSRGYDTPEEAARELNGVLGVMADKHRTNPGDGRDVRHVYAGQDVQGARDAALDILKSNKAPLMALGSFMKKMKATGFLNESGDALNQLEAEGLVDRITPRKVGWTWHPKGRRMSGNAQSNPPRGETDPAMADELVMYVDNDQQHYRQLQAIQKNLLLKMKKGKYDHALAPKGFRHVVDAAARAYAKDFGTGAISVPTRDLAARELADRFVIEAKGGEHDYLLETESRSNPTNRWGHVFKKGDPVEVYTTSGWSPGFYVKLEAPNSYSAAYGRQAIVRYGSGNKSIQMTVGFDDIRPREKGATENPHRMVSGIKVPVLSDDEVLDLFIDQKAGYGKKLTSDGQQLDGNWMGGSGIARWRSGEILFKDLGSKAAERVQRKLRKMTPKNLLDSGWTRGSKKNPTGAPRVKKAPGAYAKFVKSAMPRFHHLPPKARMSAIAAEWRSKKAMN